MHVCYHKVAPYILVVHSPIIGTCLSVNSLRPLALMNAAEHVCMCYMAQDMPSKTMYYNSATSCYWWFKTVTVN